MQRLQAYQHETLSILELRAIQNAPDLAASAGPEAAAPTAPTAPPPAPLPKPPPVTLNSEQEAICSILRKQIDDHVNNKRRQRLLFLLGMLIETYLRLHCFLEP
jgi:hypothetical protein